MFTGIVQDIGTLVAIVKNGDFLLKIKTDALSLANTSLGASMACSGICLTIIKKQDNIFHVQASSETLDKTTIKNWKIGTRINLEPALRMGDELGGHLVTGHIDGMATLTAKTKENDSLRLSFQAPAACARFLAPKGSVTLDGVSLTVNEVNQAHFTVTLIPHTQAATTLGTINVNDSVNFEADMIARYTERLLRVP